MQTNPESAAVEAVAWLVTSDDARVMCYAEGTAQAQAFELRKGGYPARIEPLYPQSALDALRGEVAAAERRVAELEAALSRKDEIIRGLVSSPARNDHRSQGGHSGYQGDEPWTYGKFGSGE